MTRTRTLKSVIRARAAKTGERYTTARRHVLRAASATVLDDSRAVVALPGAAPGAPKAKGTVSDERVLERTGHALAHWFGVLDRFGGAEKGHTAAARHLREAHQVDGWYSQGITVAYERARGLRVANQRTGGHYEVSASKVMPVDVAAAVAAMVSARRRRQWTASLDAALSAALSASLGGRTAKGFAMKANGDARCRFPWDGTAVEITVTPKRTGTCSVVVAHQKLPSPRAVEERRGQWRAALAALRSHLAD